MNKLQLEIAEAVERRSKAIHEGRAEVATLWRMHLMLLWGELPDHAPDLKPSISYDGIAYVLQSNINGVYRYVKNRIYDNEGFVYAPTDKRTRILMELHINNAAAYEIAELKANGENPIDETAEAEIA